MNDKPDPRCRRFFRSRLSSRALVRLIFIITKIECQYCHIDLGCQLNIHLTEYFLVYTTCRY